MSFFKSLNIKDKFKIAYIHFIRKRFFVLRVKNLKIKFSKAIKNPNFFLDKLDYNSEQFKSKLLMTDNYEKIIDEAELILNNRFETLNSGMRDLTENINWHQDFISGRIWEKDFYTKIKPGLSINNSDIKVCWELSRFHQTVWLGKAYLISGDIKYAKKILSLIEDWIDNNPYCYGVNWNCAMEVAIRAVNWIISIQIIKEHFVEAKEVKEKIYNSLYQHGIFIRNNLEYGRRNGNHYLSDLMGLTWLGLFFRNYKFGKRWLNFAHKEINREVSKQIYDDGVDYEKSFFYQRLVFEILYNSYIACLSAELNTEELKFKLSKMYEFILNYTEEDTVPNIGDNDNGRVTKFSISEKDEDFSGALTVGAVLFNNSVLPTSKKNFKLAADSLFLTNKLPEILYQDKRESVSFPAGGFYILKNKDFSIYADYGDIGMNGWGGHGHNDLFSFELFVNGYSFISDPGTYCYTSYPEIRQKLRSTKSHNTIYIDDREQAEFLGLFKIKEDNTFPKVTSFIRDVNGDILDGRHFSFTTENDEIVHRRIIDFNKKESIIIINDTVTGNRTARINYNLTFHPDVEIKQYSDNDFILNRAGISLKLEIAFSNNCYKLQISEGIYSKSYGHKQNTTILELDLREKLPATVSTKISRIL